MFLDAAEMTSPGLGVSEFQLYWIGWRFGSSSCVGHNYVSLFVFTQEPFQPPQELAAVIWVGVGSGEESQRYYQDFVVLALEVGYGVPR